MAHTYQHAIMRKEKKIDTIQHTCLWCGRHIFVNHYFYVVHGNDSQTGLHHNHMPMHIVCVENGFNKRVEFGRDQDWQDYLGHFQHGTCLLVDFDDIGKHGSIAPQGYDYLAKLGFKLKD